MDYKEEVELVYQLLKQPAGYDIGCGGMIWIRCYDKSQWAVEWEEYNNPHDNDCKQEVEVLPFIDAHRAAECFVELRHKCELGVDYDIEATDNPLLKNRNQGYYLLGGECEEFKRKYSK
jgi:hypothetical protein